MRIVNRQEFLAMPVGTLYAKYSSLGCWGSLAVKEDSCGSNDWFYYDLINGWGGCDDSEEFFEKVRKCEIGESVLTNDFDCSQRDGLYEDDTLFVVYDQSDIQSLVHKLTELTHLTVKT